MPGHDVAPVDHLPTVPMHDGGRVAHQMPRYPGRGARPRSRGSRRGRRCRRVQLGDRHPRERGDWDRHGRDRHGRSRRIEVGANRRHDQRHVRDCQRNREEQRAPEALATASEPTYAKRPGCTEAVRRGERKAQAPTHDCAPRPSTPKGRAAPRLLAPKFPAGRPSVVRCYGPAFLTYTFERRFAKLREMQDFTHRNPCILGCHVTAM